MSSKKDNYEPDRPGVKPPTFLSVTDLPPKPDPTTGQPRPPRVPIRWNEARKENIKDRVTDPAKTPKPPAPDLGPALAWYKPSPRQKWGVGTTGFLMITAGITLMQELEFTWMTIWWMWLFVLIPSILIGTGVRGKYCAVGADWLHTQGGWVRHYELKKATAEPRDGDTELELEDHDGRVIRPKLSAFHRDHDVWDYVHNGLTHSIIAGGAETNMMLHSSLNLPHPWPQDRRT